MAIARRKRCCVCKKLAEPDEGVQYREGFICDGCDADPDEAYEEYLSNMEYDVWTE